MRRSVDLPGFSHGSNPVPAACRLGNLVVTGAIFGRNLSDGTMPETLEAQCANVFSTLRQVLEAAGATFDDVAKVTFHLRPGLDRAAINREWVRAFPDPACRPARHVQVSDTLPAGQLVQCDALAMIRPAEDRR